MRRGKSGLDYFPLDIDFFIDEKIEFVSAKFGVIAELVTIKLLARIYRKGYFIEWGDDLPYLYAKQFGETISHELIANTVEELVNRDFFDKKIFTKYKVLTSRGVQKRFLEATKRRKQTEIYKEYLLLSQQNVNILNQNVNILELNANTMSTETPENVNIGTQSKVKESKELKTYPQKEPVFAVDEVGFAVDEEPQIQPQTSIVTPSTNGKSYVGVVGKKKVTLKGDLFYSFERFWDAFDYRKGKAEAAGAWYELNPDPDLADKIIQSAKTEAQERPDLVARNKNPKWAQGWLNLRRWDDEPTSDYQPEQPTFAPPPYWKEIN
jgi:hypothetical protein